jgi:hypothetical protein
MFARDNTYLRTVQCAREVAKIVRTKTVSLRRCFGRDTTTVVEHVIIILLRWLGFQNVALVLVGRTDVCCGQMSGGSCYHLILYHELRSHNEKQNYRIVNQR